MPREKPASRSLLVLCRDYGPVSPSGRMIQDLVRVLLKEGHSVRVLARKIAPKIPAAAKLDVQRVRFRFPGAFMVARALKDVRVDAVLSVVDDQSVLAMASRIANQRGVPHVACVWFLRGLLRPIAQTENLRLVAGGRCIAARLMACGFSAQQISIVPSWLDRALYRADPDADEALYPITALDRDIRKDDSPKFRLIFLGPEGPETPHQAIIDLATMIAGTNPEIEFLFVGNDAAQEKIADLRTARALDNIRLVPLPPPGKFKALMASADIHLITLAPQAVGHAVPQGIFAAVMAERPSIFIGPSDSEVAILIRDFQCGLVVPPFQPGALLDAVMRYRLDAKAWHSASGAAALARKSLAPEQSLRAIVTRLYDALHTANTSAS